MDNSIGALGLSSAVPGPAVPVPRDIITTPEEDSAARVRMAEATDIGLYDRLRYGGFVGMCRF
ncbi:MAG: hypothetical protein ACYS21_07495 [Planctomycetota bacterium]|jgi:hypothetical protein